MCAEVRECVECQAFSQQSSECRVVGSFSLERMEEKEIEKEGWDRGSPCTFTEPGGCSYTYSVSRLQDNLRVVLHTREGVDKACKGFNCNLLD